MYEELRDSKNFIAFARKHNKIADPRDAFRNFPAELRRNEKTGEIKLKEELL